VTQAIDPQRRDFLLYQWLDLPGLSRFPRFAEHNRDTYDAMIAAAEQLARAYFATHNRKADLHEVPFVDGRAVIIPEVKAALDAHAEAGFAAMMADAEDGGLQLPFLLASVIDCIFAAANISTTGYASLARGAANLIKAYGDAEQQRLYMRPILQGRYLGTMCLSETQAGSSLADIACSAIPQADGSYRIRGAKMWISGGDHALSENIVHMLLARIEGAPAGVRGISLFIVPRYRVNADGSRGGWNDISLAGINHKLGQRGVVNAFLKFGENEDCHGYLVGEANRGLAQMFHMMNEERLGVGFSAISLGMAGFRYSLQYARERRQGRHPDNKDPASPPVPIIEHADVRRMLLQQKAYTEGAFALGLYAAKLFDVQTQATDANEKRESDLLLDLLTPIVKAWSSDWCMKANELAIQVLGGYGYTREYPVEQHYRDTRINPIHEGTNGIQALDLLGRKVMQENGEGFRLFVARVLADAERASANPALQEFAEALRETCARAVTVTRFLGAALARGEARQALANAHHYMNLLGHLAIAWVWLAQSELALVTAKTDAELCFARGTLDACRYFFRHELPQTKPWADLLLAMDPSALDAEIAAL
jgi:butyryl-CoA dehydrogenase